MTQSSDVSISFDGSKWVILAGDVDITNAVKGLSMLARSDDRLPTVTLDIVGVGGLRAAEIRTAKLPSTARNALIALGWTPPPDVKP